MDSAYLTLKKSLPHLPPRKLRDLRYLIKVIFEEFEKERSAKTSSPDERNAKILKIILFGSYARGGWVEDRIGNYFSDYDLLAVVNNEAAATPEFWYDTQYRLADEWVKGRISAPTGLIAHSYDDINAQLAVARPFFMDIIRDGVALYDEASPPLAKAGKLSKTKRREEAQKYFAEWYQRSLVNYRFSKIAFAEAKGKMGEYMRKAAFDAHQAVESIYHCLLLTLTLYSPKLHDLHRLQQLANAVAPQLLTAWPRSNKFYRRSFARLWRAYVEARYSEHYEITAEEMKWLYQQIAKLQNSVKDICQAHLRQ